MSTFRQTNHSDVDRSTASPGYPQVVGVVWVQTDGNDFLWESSTDGWRRSSDLGPTVKWDGSPATGTWYMFNSRRYWQLSGNYLWYSTDMSEWIISSRLGTCLDEQWRGTSRSCEKVQEDPDGWQCEVTDDLTGEVVYTTDVHPTVEEAQEDADAFRYGDEEEETLPYEQYIGDAWWSADDGFDGVYNARGSGRGYTEGSYDSENAKTVEVDSGSEASAPVANSRTVVAITQVGLWIPGTAP